MRVYLEVEETKKVENAATCVRDRLLSRLLVRLGCRISEALALEVKDIDFARATVTIEHLKSRLTEEEVERLEIFFWGFFKKLNEVNLIVVAER